ncbi:major facilitator superfamily domain-containing protein [Umbelopsis sp. AD052]|nr:major facilitator superfamily domain-containing protein [Umbelopsis sp. AD052]
MEGKKSILGVILSNKKKNSSKIVEADYSTRTGGVVNNEIQSDATAKSLVRKLDIRIIPCLSALYCFAYLARGNIGNAHLTTFDQDLHLSEAEYHTSLTTFYLGYLLFQLPCSLLMKCFRPSYTLAGTMVIFGFFSLSVAGATDSTSLIVLRFFLGVFEAGIGPGVPLYLSFWYERDEMAKRVSAYFSFSTIAGALGGLVAYATFTNLQHTLGLKSWQWLFIIEGVPTILTGLLSFFILPDYPASASLKWLTEDEKALAIDRMQGNISRRDEGFDMKQFKDAIADYKNWLTALISLGLHVPLTSFLFFLPTFIQSMGFSVMTSQLMTIPPYLAAFVAILIASSSADRTMQRGLHIFVLSGIAAFGYVLAFIPSIWGKYIGIVLTGMGVYGALPILMAWTADNQYGHTKRATGLALTNMIGQSFSMLGTQIYHKDDAPDYAKGHLICFTFTLIAGAAALTLRTLLQRANNSADDQVYDEDEDVKDLDKPKYII